MKKNTKKVNKERLLKWVDKFEDVPILVVGDLMLDRSIRGNVDRISPEAPVPVLNVTEETSSPGGAGNVVYNLAALGAQPSLIAVRGHDSAGDDLVRTFQSRGLHVDGLLIDSHRPTITKTRVVAGQQQIVRVDYEKKDGFSKLVLNRLLKSVKKYVPASKGVVISDYGKGVVSLPVIRQILKEAHRRKLLVTVDPKIEHFMQYKGVDAITPNSKEAIEGMRTLAPKSEQGFVDLGWSITKKLRCQSLLMTRGSKGILLFRKNKPVKRISAKAREVFDVTGAGDTVVATFTLARAVGAPHEEAAQIANFAAGIVVAKLGTAVATRDELVQFIRQHKN